MSKVLGGVVANLKGTRNLPGYIDFSTPGTKETPSKLIAKFFKNDRIDPAKISSLISEIESYQEQARISFCQSAASEQKLSQKSCGRTFPILSLLNKWKLNAIKIASDYAILRLKEARKFALTITIDNINRPEAWPFLEAFFEAFEIYQSVVQEDQQMAAESSIFAPAKKLREAIRPMTIIKGRPEATNILRSSSDKNSAFYSPEELENLEDSGVDISLLDPIESAFWQRPKSIKNFDTTNYNRAEEKRLKKNLSDDDVSSLLNSDDEIAVTYEIARPLGVGENPKIYVKYAGVDFKVKFLTDRNGARKTTDIIYETFKFFQGSEVNTETVVNNLAAALGFVVDATYYKKKIKVFFTDEIYANGKFEQEHKKMLEVLKRRYKSSHNIESALETVKIDLQTGRKYIELKAVQLERKSDIKSDLNVGMFVRKGLGKNLKREHRAFALFMAWIWDIDNKDSNTTLKLVPYWDDHGKPRYRLAMVNSDMGSSLGSNHPNFYNFNFVRNLKKDSEGNPIYVRLNYWHAFPMDMMGAITFADAKWFARLLGQLTAEQVYLAHIAAGYPDIIAKYSSGIMMRKRNALLGALGLIGDTFTTPAGERVTLKKVWQFDGSLEGYEKYFKDGRLSDPNNELFDPQVDPFPRYWGVGINSNKGEPQEYLVNMFKIKTISTVASLIFELGLRNGSVSHKGFKFSEVSTGDETLARLCKDKCFYQGSGIGLESFIPWRFIIDNPDKASEYPFLIVDLFRLGFFAGKDLERNFGVEIPNALTLGLGAKYYHIVEFIKIKPVKGLDAFLKNKRDLFKLGTLNIRSVKESAIKGLKKGEVLIQSHYYGLRGQTKLRLSAGGFIPLPPSLTFQGDVMTANRVTILGNGNSNVTVGWGKVYSKMFRSRLNVIDYFLQIPILETEVRKLDHMQRTYHFDLNKADDQKVLFANVNSVLPNKIPTDYALAERTKNIKQKTFSAGFLNFYRRTSYKRSTEVDYKDFLTNTREKNLTYEREIKRQRLTDDFGHYHSKYKVQAAINSKNKLYAKIKLSGYFQQLNKQRFKNLLEKYKLMLPANFILFDPQAVLKNFGELDLNIETILSESALRNIFNKQIKKYGLCLKYSRLHSLGWTASNCSYLSKIRFALPRPFHWGMTRDKVLFLKLWRRYEQARISFWKLIEQAKQSLNKQGMAEYLGDIVSVLSDTGDYDQGIMKYFLDLTIKPNYYYRASMYSKLSAFPGQRDYITESPEVAGGFSPAPYMLKDNPELEYELFLDVFHDAVAEAFFDIRMAPSQPLY